MSLESKRRAAVEAVLTGMTLAKSLQHRLTSSKIMKKEDFSPVTVADFGVQALISRRLKDEFPDIPLVGEEDASNLEKDGRITELGREVIDNVQEISPDFEESRVISAIGFGRKDVDYDGPFWVLDPIDGTKGFIRGDQYAIALSYFENGEPVLAFLGCPNLPLEAVGRPDRQGLLLAAQKGAGAFERTVQRDEFMPIRVSNLDRVEQARICESVEPGSSNLDKSERLRGLLGMAESPCRMDGQTKYASVSRGDGHFYLRMPHKPTSREYIWDHAAGTLMVEEAGGRVTDLYGHPLDFRSGQKLTNNFGVLASNGRFHDRILEALQHPEVGVV